MSGAREARPLRAVSGVVTLRAARRKGEGRSAQSLCLVSFITFLGDIKVFFFNFCETALI